MNERVLLIEPNFPNLNESNKDKYLPIGLLKIGSYYKSQGAEVKLQRMCEDVKPISFQPTIVHITSSFTYYSKYVIDAVSYVRFHYSPNEIIIGGIWASLMPNECAKLTRAKVHQGICKAVEKFPADYSLLSSPTNYQIIHTMRGCPRKCPQCASYKLEELEYMDSIKEHITRKNVLIYDNNFLANPNIESILQELVELKKEGRISTVESQSGFDGRILRKKPYLAKMLKDAGFIKPKIAWDVPFKTKDKRKQELDILKEAGFSQRLTSVFILYNYLETFEEVEKKRANCFEWGVQVTHSRYHPLDSLSDNFNALAKQSPRDYYISPLWNDEQVKLFGRNAREHNIAIRFGSDFYSADWERRRITSETSDTIKHMNFDEAKNILGDAWSPMLPRLVSRDREQKSLDSWGFC